MNGMTSPTSELGIVRRLRARSLRPWSQGVEVLNNADGPEAADLIEQLYGALTVIRTCWAGHAEQCAFVTSGYRAKCDCDWPKVAAQCDAALTATRDAGKSLPEPPAEESR